MRNFTGRSAALHVLYCVLISVAIGLAALSAVSCRTQRSVEDETIRADTLSSVSTESVTVETVAQAVAGDSVSLTVPMEVMQSLPDGAEFSRKQGRTRLSLRRQGGAVVAEAVTDSVAREVSRYERKARDSLQQRGQTALHTASMKEKPPNAGWTFAVMGGMLIIVAVVAATAIRTLFK